MTTIYVTRDTPLPTRRAHELYPTERSLILAALETYAHYPVWGDRVLDCGAGDGRWGQALRTLHSRATLHGVELRRVQKPEGFDKWWACRDFLKFHPPWLYDHAIGNPPYNLAERFVRHTWELLAPGGRILFLLPLQFQASTRRYHGLWVTHPPTLVAVVSPRPSFGLNQHGRRGTNGTDYGLFVWDKALDGACAGTARRWETELFTYEPEYNNQLEDK